MTDRVGTRTLTRTDLRQKTLTSTEEKVVRMLHGVTVGADERLGTIEAADEVDRNYVLALEAKAVEMMQARARSKKSIIEKLRKK